ncbi:MAG: tetratricopeptide repeat protein [Bacteroidota bacterium]
MKRKCIRFDTNLVIKSTSSTGPDQNIPLNNFVLKRSLIFMFFIPFVLGCSLKPVVVSKEVDSTENNMDFEFQYAFIEATKQMIFGNINQATTIYNSCLEVKNDHAPSYYQLSKIYLMKNDKDRSLGLAKKAVHYDDNNYWYMLQLARAYQFKNFIDSTIYVYEDMIYKFPERIDIMYELAVLYTENGKYEEALSLFEEIEISKGISENITLGKYQIYLEKKEYKLAIKEITKLIELNSDNVKYWGILAEVYGSAGKINDALRAYQEVFRLDEDNTLGLLSIHDYYLDIGLGDSAVSILGKIVYLDDISIDNKINTIITYLERSDFHSYLDSLERYINVLITRHPDNFKLYALRADVSIRGNDLISAAADLKKVIDFDKANYVIYEQLVFILNSLSDYNEIIDYAEKGLMKYPDKHNLYLMSGLAYMQTNRNDSALLYLKAGKEYANTIPVKLQFYGFMADVFYKVGEVDSSFFYFDKVIEHDKSNLIILNNYSYYLSLENRDLDKAEEMSKICINKEPDNPTYLDTYAWIKFKMKDYKVALRFIEEAVANSVEIDIDILEHYGDILYKNGMVDKAIEVWHTAIKEGANKILMMEKIKNGI